MTSLLSLVDDDTVDPVGRPVAHVVASCGFTPKKLRARGQGGPASRVACYRVCGFTLGAVGPDAGEAAGAPDDAIR